MYPLRRISGFFVRCLLLYALLMWPQIKLMDAYRVFFSAGGNALFHSFGKSGVVSFKRISSEDHTKDTAITLEKLKPRHVRGTMEIKCVYTGYRPTAFVVALILATPVSWRRRLWALLWGLILINAFVAFRVGLVLFDAFSDNNVLALFTLSRNVKIGLKMLKLVFYRAPEMHYIVPAFIWLLVTFRRDDLRRVLTRTVRNKDAVDGPASPAETADATG